MKRAAVYTNSQDSQEAHGGLSTQAEICRQWAEQNGYSESIFRETNLGSEAVTAQIVKLIQTGGCDAVLLSSPGVVGRRPDRLHRIAHAGREAGISVIDVASGFDLTSTASKISLDLVATVAELEYARESAVLTELDKHGRCRVVLEVPKEWIAEIPELMDELAAHPRVVEILRAVQDGVESLEDL
ncbi:recombinase family protein [Streptomyces tubercidicus]|uniref:recombinase family protein n=1 Tax=Streptomyces tubercidicus TaxID=47759 RepID=UPI00368D7A04